MGESKEYIDELGAKDSHGVSFSMCRAKTRRVKLAKKVSQRKFMVCTCRLKYYNQASVSTASIEEDFIPQIPWHAIFVFIDPILLGVMQVEYQNKKQSPFDTHPLQKNTFLTAICIYGALLGIKVHTKTCRDYLEKILSYGLLLSGGLSSLSLLSILLQQQLLLIVLIIWGSIPLILSHHMLKSAACRTVKFLAKLTWDVSDKHSSACGKDICARVEVI